MLEKWIFSLLRFTGIGKRLFCVLGLIEIVTWSALIATVGVWWTLAALIAPKILISLYLWWRWHRDVKFAVAKLEEVEKSRKKQARAQGDPVYQRDYLRSHWFFFTLLPLILPSFTSYLVVGFFFVVGTEHIISGAALRIVRRTEEKELGVPPTASKEA